MDTYHDMENTPIGIYAIGYIDIMYWDVLFCCIFQVVCIWDKFGKMAVSRVKCHLNTQAE